LRRDHCSYQSIRGRKCRGLAVNPESSWGVQIAMLHKQGSQHVQRRLVPFGLGTGLHPYLLALESGARNQEELSERLLVDKANTTRALGKLEAVGFVSRGPHPSDGRAKTVELTDRGRRILPTIRAALEEWETELKQRLGSADAAMFQLLLGELTARVEDEK
jgi:DNA-binding MarR family transcriptional regulator